MNAVLSVPIGRVSSVSSKVGWTERLLSSVRLLGCCLRFPARWVSRLVPSQPLWLSHPSLFSSCGDVYPVQIPLELSLALSLSPLVDRECGLHLFPLLLHFGTPRFDICSHSSYISVLIASYFRLVFIRTAHDRCTHYRPALALYPFYGWLMIGIDLSSSLLRLMLTDLTW